MPCPCCAEMPIGAPKPERMKLGLGELAGHAFGLVDGDHDGFRFAPQTLGDLACPRP